MQPLLHSSFAKPLLYNLVIYQQVRFDHYITNKNGLLKYFCCQGVMLNADLQLLWFNDMSLSYAHSVGADYCLIQNSIYSEEYAGLLSMDAISDTI